MTTEKVPTQADFVKKIMPMFYPDTVKELLVQTYIDQINDYFENEMTDSKEILSSLACDMVHKISSQGNPDKFLETVADWMTEDLIKEFEGVFPKNN